MDSLSTPGVAGLCDGACVSHCAVAALAETSSAFLEVSVSYVTCRQVGASASDHEARAGRRFEPQGGIHQWPDGRVAKTFRRQQRCQFLPWTPAKEGQMGLKLLIDRTIGHLKNAFDQDQ